MKKMESSFTWDSGLGKAEFTNLLTGIKNAMEAQDLDALIIYGLVGISNYVIMIDMVICRIH